MKVSESKIIPFHKSRFKNYVRSNQGESCLCGSKRSKLQNIRKNNKSATKFGLKGRGAKVAKPVFMLLEVDMKLNWRTDICGADEVTETNVISFFLNGNNACAVLLRQQ